MWPPSGEPSAASEWVPGPECAQWSKEQLYKIAQKLNSGPIDWTDMQSGESPLDCPICAAGEFLFKRHDLSHTFSSLFNLILNVVSLVSEKIEFIMQKNLFELLISCPSGTLAFVLMVSICLSLFVS